MTGVAALLIGGRSGVGKSTVGWEVAAQLTAADVAHAYLEGDALDAVHPRPAVPVAERNLTALWRTFAACGQRRLVYTNTASVTDSAMIRRALAAAGADPVRVLGVLLTASDDTANRRLAGREIGSELDRHVRRSAEMARRLATEAPPWVARIRTDDRTVADIAAEIVAYTGWRAGPGLA